MCANTANFPKKPQALTRGRGAIPHLDLPPQAYCHQQPGHGEKRERDEQRHPGFGDPPGTAAWPI